MQLELRGIVQLSQLHHKAFTVSTAISNPNCSLFFSHSLYNSYLELESISNPLLFGTKHDFPWP